jgi:hypothetical protein
MLPGDGDGDGGGGEGGRENGGGDDSVNALRPFPPVLGAPLMVLRLKMP